MKTTTPNKNNGIITLVAAAGICAFFSLDASAMPPSKTTPAVAHSKSTKAVKSVPATKRSGESVLIRKTPTRPRTIGLVMSTKTEAKATPYYKRKQSRP